METDSSLRAERKRQVHIEVNITFQNWRLFWEGAAIEMMLVVPPFTELGLESQVVGESRLLKAIEIMAMSSYWHVEKDGWCCWVTQCAGIHMPNKLTQACALNMLVEFAAGHQGESAGWLKTHINDQTLSDHHPIIQYPIHGCEQQCWSRSEQVHV